MVICPMWQTMHQVACIAIDVVSGVPCTGAPQGDWYMAGAVGIEPTTFGFGDRRSTN